MSLLDKVASAVMPAASEEDRAQARLKAESFANGDDWLGLILNHHREIEQAFAQGLHAADASSRQEAARRLAELLTGHSTAEEAVIYPAIVEHSGKSHAAMAFEEQSMAKVQLAMLEQLDPMSQEWREKLEHLQGAVQQHVYQEESSWFPDVAQNAPILVQTRLTERYREEYERYMNGGRESRSAFPQTGT
jgi:hemerythrin superfamily protein